MTPMRISFGILAGLALGMLGCDAGGLILVETKNPPAKPDPKSSEIVSGGNVAKNGKYTVVHTLGQPTPQSRVKGSEKVLNGGIVGATQPK